MAGNISMHSTKAKLTPQTIISPKSMTGRMSLTTSEAKLTTVVAEVNSDGAILLRRVSRSSSRWSPSGDAASSSR